MVRRLLHGISPDFSLSAKIDTCPLKNERKLKNPKKKNNKNEVIPSMSFDVTITCRTRNTQLEINLTRDKLFPIDQCYNPL